MNTIRAFVLLSICLLSLSLQAQIYSWVDEQGNRMYSDQKPASGQDSTTVKDSGTANYFEPLSSDETTPSPTKQQTESHSLQSSHSNAESSPGAENVMTEQYCQEIYQLPCDRVVNWEKYALADCDNDDRCEDSGFLERKYKPLAIADIQRRANSAGARRNAQERKLMKYLRNKYSDQCENQVEAYCSRKPDSRACDVTMIQVCEDDRTLEEMLARYNNLSPTQKRRVLAMADEMSPMVDWEQASRILGDIVELIALGAGV
jgi:hypothetical protein